MVLYCTSTQMDVDEQRPSNFIFIYFTINREAFIMTKIKFKVLDKITLFSIVILILTSMQTMNDQSSNIPKAYDRQIETT